MTIVACQQSLVGRRKINGCGLRTGGRALIALAVVAVCIVRPITARITAPPQNQREQLPFSSVHLLPLIVYLVS